jgi:nicotinate-nucleotide--dimethylbenzimidazole phosphoribosyltransferase
MQSISEDVETRVRARLNSLTKPPGSLGRLEEIAIRFASIRGEEMPSAARKAVYVFCGDHGVTAEGVSAYPSEVTQQMMRNFVEGGAAINVLCRSFGAEAVIVDAGSKAAPLEGVLNRKIAAGTRNFVVEPAMTREQAEQSLAIGREMAEEAADRYDIVGLGEMGIGNTTSAAAILSVFARRPARETAGRGAGVDDRGFARKLAAIERALEFHNPDPADPVGVLAAVGGFEIGAIAGFILGAAESGLPVVLDGFPCCAGALIACGLKAVSVEKAFFSHESAEPGHRMMLDLLHATPLLNLGMRLGEGTGAALAMNLIGASVALYREMATFSEASVSTKSAS